MNARPCYAFRELRITHQSSIRSSIIRSSRTAYNFSFRAIREALGMTTGQLAKRLGVHEPRVIELERGEATGNITVKSLERAAEALGCRLVYVFVPEEPLADVIRKRASVIADQQLASVEQTMRLEAQSVNDKAQHREAHQR